MLQFDPDTGSFYDDAYDDPYGYNATDFMQPQSSPAYSTSKWNFGEQLPMGQPQINQQLTGRTNLMKLMWDPRVRMEAMLETGQPTMDLNAWGGLNPDGTPYTGDGGAGGGGGGGGNGYNPNFIPKYLNALKGSSDPVSKAIGEQIELGEDPAAIMTRLEKTYPEWKNDYNGETYKRYYDLAQKAFDDKFNVDKNEVAGLNQPAVQTPVQKWAAQYGYVDPTLQYDENNLPSDVDLSSIDAYNTRAATNDKEMDTHLGALQRMLRRTPTEEGVGTGGFFSRLGDVVGAAAQRRQAPPALPGQKARYAGVNLGGRVTGTAPTGYAAGDAKQRAQEVMGRFLNTAKSKREERNAPVREQRRGLEKQIKFEQGLRQSNERNRSDYEGAMRRFAGRQLQAQGRTPARDANRVVIEYLRRGGLGV